MKKILVTVISLFCLTFGYSQIQDFKKNEVSIGFASINQSPDNQEQIFKNSYYINPFNSLTYKRYVNNNNAIRLTFIKPINESYDNTDGGDIIDFGNYKEQVYKIGYEYIFKKRKITPYIAVDFTYFKSTSSKVFGGGFTGLTYKTIVNNEGIGLTPSIGVNYKVYKTIYVGLESSLSIIDMKSKKTVVQEFPNTNTLQSNENSKSTKYLFNPLSFIIKIKF